MKPYGIRNKNDSNVYKSKIRKFRNYYCDDDDDAVDAADCWFTNSSVVGISDNPKSSNDVSAVISILVFVVLLLTVLILLILVEVFIFVFVLIFEVLDVATNRDLFCCSNTAHRVASRSAFISSDNVEEDLGDEEDEEELEEEVLEVDIEEEEKLVLDVDKVDDEELDEAEDDDDDIGEDFNVVVNCLFEFDLYKGQYESV